MAAGIPADDPRATDLAERHRQHISRWFYDCTYDMHRGLAEMYLADERFTRTYDDLAPGPGPVRARRDAGQRRPRRWRVTGRPPRSVWGTTRSRPPGRT
jgi:TipAS antibiotic-recognition domain